MALLAIGVVAGAVFMIRWVPTFEEQRKQQLEVFDFQVQRVSRFTMKRGADLVYDIVLDKGEWVYKYPPIGKADAAKVIRVLSDLRFDARVIQDLSQDGQHPPLDRFGFDKPRPEVDLYIPGKTYVFQIGLENATKDGVYLRLLPGDRVVVTDKKIAALFDVAPVFFQQKDMPGEGPK
jgi:hypothetical protein